MQRLLHLNINPFLGAVIILSLLVCIWGWFSSGLVLKVPRFQLRSSPAEYGLKYESVEFPTTGKIVLKGWYVLADKPSSKTIMICHGWGANKSDILSFTSFLAARGGYNLFYFDFRNHGDSGGSRSSLGKYEIQDILSAYEFVKRTRPGLCRQTALFGFSMGAGAAVGAASKLPEIAGVVAENPFSSFDDVVARFAKLYYKVPRTPLVDITLAFVRLRLGFNPNDYSPVKYIAEVSPRPLLIIQGGSDQRMPPRVGKELYEAAKNPKELWIVEGADHGEAYMKSGRRYELKLLEFFAKAIK